MKVVLLENVKNLGQAGEVVEVADGYARNFLFPRELAAVATGSHARTAEAQKARATRASEEELATMQRLAELTDQKTIRLERPLGPQEKLHGAVTAKEVVAAIENALHISLPADVVRLPLPIHEPGQHTVTLEFPHGLEAEVTVVVGGKLQDAPRSRKEKTDGGKA
ncbi:MAG: large subunit ribosomal protein L9 [Parcubacteria group bacterium Gr01-1014_38]|nr:MAG: large subunit ribosomal protein L9 [Parcubacteria group bacterium Gr01-1014_38]